MGVTAFSSRVGPLESPNLFRRSGGPAVRGFSRSLLQQLSVSLFEAKLIVVPGSLGI
jgi:hypothetical protein